MSIKSVMPSNHLIICHPLLLLPSVFPSIRVFSNESALHIRWPNIGLLDQTKHFFFNDFNAMLQPCSKLTNGIPLYIDKYESWPWLLDYSLTSSSNILYLRHSVPATLISWLFFPYSKYNQYVSISGPLNLKFSLPVSSCPKTVKDLLLLFHVFVQM